jgi:hypothetical protein
MYHGDLIDYMPEGFEQSNFELTWQMTRVERLAFLDILNSIKPGLSLEIGTDKGGSLEAIMKYSKNAISIDINSHNQNILSKLDIFKNVKFISGNSAQLLPELIDVFNANAMHPDFFLIDGDHSASGALRDMNSILNIQPIKPICVIMHDSFMPSVRRAILDANWNGNPFVHYVEVDYAYGSFIPLIENPSNFKMVGGLAVALLKPVKRNFDLPIYESNKYAFDQLLKIASNNQ